MRALVPFLFTAILIFAGSLTVCNGLDNANISDLSIKEYNPLTGASSRKNIYNFYDIVEILRLISTPGSYSSAADLDNNGKVGIFDLLLLFKYLNDPPELIENAVVGDPVVFPVKLKDDQKFFKMIVQSTAADTLVISLPAADPGYFEPTVNLQNIIDACRQLTEASYIACSTLDRQWRPPAFAPAGTSGDSEPVPRIMVLPDSGLSIELLPVEGKEQILDKLGFIAGSRSSAPTALKPSVSFDLSGLRDSLMNTELRPAPALIQIKINLIVLSDSSGLNSSSEAKNTGAQLSGDYELPPYTAYFFKEDANPLKENIPSIQLYETVAKDGTVLLENVYDFVSGHSMVVLAVKYEEIKTRLYVETNVGKTLPFSLKPNYTHTPEILHFDKPFSINARIENISDSIRYVIWDSIPVAEYYTIHEVPDEDFGKTPARKIQSPSWQVLNLDAGEILFNISAYGYKNFVKTSASYIYRPQDGYFSVK